MSILANKNAIGGGNYLIERSLRFQSASSQSLSRTFSAGTQTKWTLSVWVKRGTLATFPILNEINSATNNTQLNIRSTDVIQLRNEASGTVTVDVNSDAVFRDPSAWYHIVFVYDSTQAAQADRAKLYVNGASSTLTQATTITLNETTRINGATAHSIGYDVQNAAYADGYMAEYYFIDNQALLPTSFGETDPVTGSWIAKPYTGTYGTNGFYLKFNDGTSTTTLGQDRSGNANNWTLTNFTRSAGVSDCWMYDVPSGNGSPSATQPSSNYAVMNPLVQSSGLTGGNLNVVTLAAYSGANVHSSSIALPSSGKFYWEYIQTVAYSGTALNKYFGVSINFLGTNATKFVTYNGDGSKYIDNVNSAYGASWTTNDVIACAVDLDGGTVTFYKNGVSQGAITYNASEFYAFVSDGNSTYSLTGSINFGQRSFAYTPPSGFRALCTANLPAPTIAKGNQYMDATIYAGNGAASSGTTQTITTAFTPDLLWIKNRTSGSSNHVLFDSLRGNNSLSTNNTNTDIANGNQAFVTNGYVVAENGGTGNIAYNPNLTGNNYVGWVWDAGSSTVTNTSGSISSQVRANTTAGFSIVTYTSNSGTVSTVGHGLGVAPSMLIFKNRTLAATDWVVYHQSLGNTRAVFLNLTNAQTTSSTYFNNTSPTSSVFTIGSSNNLNNSTNAIVCYAFAEIAGFSKIGSYTGNGNADGPFVYCGFRPKFVMIKRIDAAGNNWSISDSARNSYNVANLEINPNLSNAESTTTSTTWPYLDMVSNGFKCRSSSNGGNASGGTYIFMAFAENPFNYSNAR